MTNETIELDPPEFNVLTDRVALGLDELGIRVMKAEWGDAEHELFLVKQERGEIPADRHPPNRTVTLMLKAEEDDEHEVSLAEALQRLQQKVGLFQEEGGWVKRILDVKGQYSTNVGMRVLTAVLGGIHGWQMAHRSIAPEISLTLTVGPYCYGTKEVATEVFEATGVRQLEAKISNIIGTAPGLFRIRVENTGPSNWLGFIAALETRDHREEPTAKMTYKANELTLLGKASEQERWEASEKHFVKVVRSGKLNGNWQSILSSKNHITGEHMTHVGPRRFLIRIYDENIIGIVRLELQWRVLGSARWISNDEEQTMVSGNFSFVDMGEVKPELATLGEQLWEWRVLAKTSSGAELEIDLDEIHIMTTEQYLIFTEEIEAVTGGTPIWFDNFHTQTTGNATGKTAPIGGIYEGFGPATDLKINATEGLLESG